MLLSGLLTLLGNVMFFTSYVEKKNSFPRPLSAEKERELLAKTRDGDKSARDELVRHNMRLVAHIAKKYANYPDSDELMSVGSMGLVKAVNTYKGGKGTGLATYAARCIENEILMVIRANKKYKNNRSLYEPVSFDKEGNEITLIDLLSMEEDSVISNVENEIIRQKLLGVVKASLDEREYDIIKLRYGLEGEEVLTQREIARKHGISRSYISRIEKKALLKLREQVEKDELFL